MASVAVFFSCMGAVQARTAVSPHLGTPKAEVGRYWKLNAAEKTPCTSVAGYSLCDYIAQGLHVSVGYNVHTGNRAYDFITSGYRDFGTHRHWLFLVGLLPAGSKRTACKTIQSTGGANGPAYACVYRWGKRQIVVAQYLRPTDPLTEGETKLDANFNDIAAAT